MWGVPQMQASGDGCSKRPKGAVRVPGDPEHPQTCSSSISLRSQEAESPYKCLRHRFTVEGFWWVRVAQHVEASRDGCSERPKGAGRGPWVRTICRLAAAASAFGRRWLTHPTSALDTVSALGGFWWLRGAPHVQASGDGCSERRKGAGRVPGGS